MITIKKGLKLPISGEPEQVIHNGPTITEVAILGEEYIGMRPSMAVKVGDAVKKGQLLFSDKKNVGVKFTAPASGIVKAINRGAKRVLQSVVISVSGQQSLSFCKYESAQLSSIERSKIVDNLVESGAWTAFRTRPFSKVPEIKALPASIFVTAMDTNPLAADAALIINENQQAFIDGLALLSQLTVGNVYVCKGESSLPQATQKNVQEKVFSGVHPAGLAGTHIHFIDPVSITKSVWSINYQDVIAFGLLFTSGELYVNKVISLAGPAVKKPRLLRTILGASITELTENEFIQGEVRSISGSVFCGVSAGGAHAFLGRYHNQVSALIEGYEKELFGWGVPGSEKFSVAKVFISALKTAKRFAFTTTTGGSKRAMVPIGQYERIMPLDILPTVLLRDLIVGDSDGAQTLGCLELDEEDLALCTYVCPGKYDYGSILRSNLSKIEKEG
ncbi:Na(+)-translocating NADH-quinone reductase subunit A [Psychromonas antarctica]|jgi:Na+-transporting NADH:ubiquinone oxidoreductase subunit A|uniref:Na(+)-translocating NADH-quinone reductase subunit A n=1 Tax=Psychromonas antarctica TaxID=67573 RepID=UPI001EE8F29F|nr:Na(+)-translocating NADH-quinone reductase subunit A [Psychromonas antarctica]MCG6199885.1 Na(+)-translocating NADH-quinone reductase subunit A [Psychromonas antarctica]